MPFIRQTLAHYPKLTDTLKDRVHALRLYGLIAHWDDIGEYSWLPTLIAWEEEERRSRSLKRRLSEARIGHFKPLVDFDWDWPRRCDQMVIEDLMSLEFLREAANVVLVGPTRREAANDDRAPEHELRLQGALRW